MPRSSGSRYPWPVVFPRLANMCYAHRMTHLPATVQAIIKSVAAEYHVATQAIRSTTRSQPIARARQVCMYVMRETLGLSYPAIGRAFVRDHSTVIHACRSVVRRLGHDTKAQRAVAAANDAVNRVRGGEARAIAIADVDTPELDAVAWAQACRVAMMTPLSAPELYAQLVDARHRHGHLEDTQVIDAVQVQRVAGRSPAHWVAALRR